MKLYTELEKNMDEIHRILEIYNRDLPFPDVKNIPNNWLKMHGYAMRKKKH